MNLILIHNSNFLDTQRKVQYKLSVFYCFLHYRQCLSKITQARVPGFVSSVLFSPCQNAERNVKLVSYFGLVPRVL